MGNRRCSPKKQPWDLRGRVYRFPDGNNLEELQNLMSARFGKWQIYSPFKAVSLVRVPYRTLKYHRRRVKRNITRASYTRNSGFDSHSCYYISPIAAMLGRNLFLKEVFIIIPITKQERDWLYEHGVPYGENGISRTNSHHKRYFLTCTRNNLNMVRLYHQSLQILSPTKSKEEKENNNGKKPRFYKKHH